MGTNEAERTVRATVAFLSFQQIKKNKGERREDRKEIILKR